MEKQSAGGGGGSGGDAEVSGLRCVEEFLGSPKEVPLWPAGRPGGPGVSARRLGALGTDSSRPCSSSRRMLEVAKALDTEEDARFSRSLLFPLVLSRWALRLKFLMLLPWLLSLFLDHRLQRQ